MPALECVLRLDNALDRNDRIGSGRNDRPGRDPHRLTRRERPCPWDAARCARDRERPRRICGANGEAVHRRARKRRQIRGCQRRLGEHAAEGAREFDRLHASGRAWASTVAIASSSGSRVDHGANATWMVPGRYAPPVLSVVIPVYNEERSVATLVQELRSRFELSGREWEAVFVDDGSTDGTWSGADAARGRRARRADATQLRQGGGAEWPASRTAPATSS